MYEYLSGMVDRDVAVHLTPGALDQPGAYFIIEGVLHMLGDDYLVVLDGTQTEYVVPFASIKLVKVQPAKDSEGD